MHLKKYIFKDLVHLSFGIHLINIEFGNNH